MSGKRAGDEVVQLYLRALDPQRPRAVKELRGAARLTLKPGESSRVSFEITPSDDLRHYDVDQKDYAVDAGRYEVQIGASSADIRLRQSFAVAAER